MKKLLCIILSLAMLVSCSEKTTDDTAVYEEENVQETTEPVFMEYKDSDFTDITVTPTVQTSSPPFEVTEIDFSELNLGTKISPCKHKEVIVDYVAEPYNPENYNPEESESDLFWYNEASNYIKSMTDSECSAMVNCATLNGDTIYMVANFDNLNFYYSHESAIYSYNLKTKKVNELYVNSQLENGVAIFALKYINGNLYFVRDIDGAEGYEMLRLNPETKEVEQVFDSNFGYESYGYDVGSEDRLIVRTGDYTENSQTAKLMEYDFDSDTWNEIYFTESTREDNAIVTGDSIALQTKNDDRNAVVETENFRLETSIKGNLISACDNTVTILQTNRFNGYSTNQLYVYNLEKMERYILDVSSYANSVYPAGKNVIVMGNNPFCYYLIPEIGAMFTICNTNITPETIGNKTYIQSIDNINGYTIDAGDITYSYTFGEDDDEHTTKKIYVIDNNF